MITKQINNLPKSQIEVQITVPWADMESKWNETLQKVAVEVEVPGFRKGAAPLPMVEQSLGRKLEDEVFKSVMPQTLIEALQGTNIVPIDYPQYQIINFQKGVQLQFTAKVTQRPEIKVSDYKSIKVSRPPLKQVTQEDVSKIVDDLYKRWRLKNPGQPQPNQAGGGSLSFQSSISDGPDDNFAKAVGANDIHDLKDKIRLDLESENKYNNELDYEEAILQEVEKMTAVDLPDVLVQDELNRMLLSLQRNVTDRGLLLEEYLKSQSKTVEQIKNEWRPQAEKNVRMELGLSEVARLEGVNIADDELQAEIDKIQDARVKAQFESQEPRMHLRHALRQTKTLNFLKTIVGNKAV